VVRTLPIAVTALATHPRGEIGDQNGDQHEEKERRDVGRLRDRESVDRREKEEVVAKRGDDARQYRRQQAVADGGPDHGVRNTRSTFSMPNRG